MKWKNTEVGNEKEGPGFSFNKTFQYKDRTLGTRELRRCSGVYKTVKHFASGSQLTNIY